MHDVLAIFKFSPHTLKAWFSPKSKKSKKKKVKDKGHSKKKDEKIQKHQEPVTPKTPPHRVRARSLATASPLLRVAVHNAHQSPSLRLDRAVSFESESESESELESESESESEQDPQQLDQEKREQEYLELVISKLLVISSQLEERETQMDKQIDIISRKFLSNSSTLSSEQKNRLVLITDRLATRRENLQNQSATQKAQISEQVPEPNASKEIKTLCTKHNECLNTVWEAQERLLTKIKRAEAICQQAIDKDAKPKTNFDYDEYDKENSYCDSNSPSPFKHNASESKTETIQKLQLQRRRILDSIGP